MPFGAVLGTTDALNSPNLPRTSAFLQLHEHEVSLTRTCGLSPRDSMNKELTLLGLDALAIISWLQAMPP